MKSYKVHEIEAVPEDEWVRVADTHEAIIDRETFEKVQALLKRDTRTAPRKRSSICSAVFSAVRIAKIHYTKPEREKCVLRLLYLQIPLPDCLLHALNQA